MYKIHKVNKNEMYVTQTLWHIHNLHVHRKAKASNVLQYLWRVLNYLETNPC